MKRVHMLLIFAVVVLFSSCENDGSGLEVINSKSFSEKQIILSQPIRSRLLNDSTENTADNYPFKDKLNKMNLALDELEKNHSDSIWQDLLLDWNDFRLNHTGKDGLPVISKGELADSVSNSEVRTVAEKWGELNSKLLKFSGEVRFGDVLENLFNKPQIPVLNEMFVKSIFYTHVDDQIFVNLLGSSAVTHYHTTGGIIKLSQVTDFPASNEVVITCESDDSRFLDLFIRIPGWAINPTVTHGNVKYVAHPGEYCEIARKWKGGDEFIITLKN